MVGTVNVQGRGEAADIFVTYSSTAGSLLVLSWFKLVSCGDDMEEGGEFPSCFCDIIPDIHILQGSWCFNMPL